MSACKPTAPTIRCWSGRSPPPASGGAWTYAVNLVVETALGKGDAFYAKSVDAAGKIAAGCAAAGVRKLVQVSSAYVYKPGGGGKAGCREDAPTAPWTSSAEACLACEAAVRAVPGLPVVVLRPALVYGPGDVAGLMSRCVVAAAYVKMAAKMDFLWDAGLRVNTVHVYDVARAIFFAARKVEPGTGA